MTPTELLDALRAAAEAGDGKAAAFLPAFERWASGRTYFDDVLTGFLDRFEPPGRPH